LTGRNAAVQVRARLERHRRVAANVPVNYLPPEIAPQETTKIEKKLRCLVQSSKITGNTRDHSELKGTSYEQMETHMV
jgi:hypothetical protein